MADFIYRFGEEIPDIPKFKTLYGEKHTVVPGCDVFYNGDTVTHIEEGTDSLTLIGYVYRLENDLERYLSGFLRDFTPENIAEAKKVLLGQYTVIVSKGDSLYLFSDFLQVRSIYYGAGMACSSFGVLHALSGGSTDEYKIFEFLSMRHCSYPAWLGDTTLDDRIKRLRACEYLKIDIPTGRMETAGFAIAIDNTRSGSLKEIGEYTQAVLQSAIRHPAFGSRKVSATLTGGFDSRLVTALVNEYYSETELRISAYKETGSLDLTIAARVADTLSMPLEVYETDLEKQKAFFYFLTDGLAPRENAVITQLLCSLDDETLGFGGAFGTELYTVPAYPAVDELIAGYKRNAGQHVKADAEYYDRFETALRDEFEYIRRHYILRNSDERDYMRLFRLVNTGYFSSPLVSAFNIFGNQYEVFGTFPVIEAGLKIPYEYMGDKRTFGRFYLVPKRVLAAVNPRISRLATTHFCPMCPLSVLSFLPYVLGRFRRKAYYKKQAKLHKDGEMPLSFETKRIRYASNGWFEGFMRAYMIEK